MFSLKSLLLLVFALLLWVGKTDINENECTDIIGIDLGTTYSCVGIAVNGKIEIIPNDQGNRITPSYIAYTNDGKRLVGDPAKNQLASNPENTIFDVKRMIGRSWDEDVVQKDVKNYPFKVIESDGKIKIVVKHDKDTLKLSPEQISAMVLSKLKETAESYLKCKVTKAVITVPAYFSDAQRQATKDAGRIAGLEVKRIINEPTAAAIAYGLDKQNGEKTILVYDLGGGTFDVSLMTIDNGVFEVIATSGDTHLGGQDFDQRVIDELLNQWLKINTGKNKVRQNKASIQKLRQEAEKAKRSLSSSFEALIEIDGFFEGIDLSLTLTAAKFEEINADLFRSTMKPIDKVLKDSGTSVDEIDEIVMVGGSTRIPKIQQLVKNYFNKELHMGLNPDEAVAYGAAVHGGVLSGKFKESSPVLIDVVPLTLGIETVGGVMTKIIPLNSIIPTKKTQTFSTAKDNQEAVTIRVFEGEREFTKDNHLLGQFDLRGIPPAQRGVPQIEVTFGIDVNGILTVGAEEKGSNNKHEIQITSKDNRLSPEEVERMIKEAEKYEASDREQKKLVEARHDLEALAYRVQQQANTEASKLSSSDKDVLLNAAKDTISFVDNNPSATLEEIQSQKEELERIIKPIMESLYGKDGDSDDHTEL